MKSKLILSGLLLAAGVTGAVQTNRAPRVRFTVRVIDEAGQPVANAKVSSIFEWDARLGMVEADSRPPDGITEANGNFTVDNVSDSTFATVVRKDGYYVSYVKLPDYEKVKDGHWLPWDQTLTTTLRKIGNPVPMYVHRLRRLNGEAPDVKIPGAINEPCDYDLAEADWVAPYGKGKVTDFIVTLTKAQYRSDDDFEASATITFPHDGDGILETQIPDIYDGSQFRWPREAPSTGYQPKLEMHTLWYNDHSVYDEVTKQGGPKQISTWKPHQAFFFRVRTVKQGDKVTSALYGKIPGGIGVDVEKGNLAYMNFTYYLNPTPNDRNMEWDTKKNLAATSNIIPQFYEP